MVCLLESVRVNRWSTSLVVSNAMALRYTNILRKIVHQTSSYQCCFAHITDKHLIAFMPQHKFRFQVNHIFIRLFLCNCIAIVDGLRRECTEYVYVHVHVQWNAKARKIATICVCKSKCNSCQRETTSIDLHQYFSSTQSKRTEKEEQSTKQ